MGIKYIQSVLRQDIRDSQSSEKKKLLTKRRENTSVWQEVKE